MLTPLLKNTEMASRVEEPASTAAPMVASVSLAEVTRLVPTPFYIYDGEFVIQRIKEVQQALGPETMLHYSIKANPSLGLCQLMAREGVGVEVASLGELLLATRAGFPAGSTLFAGPGKTDEELRAAVETQIAAVHVESMGELKRLACIAGALGKTVRVAIRVNPRQALKGAHLRMGGGPQQFGIDEERLDEAVELTKAHAALRLVGIHVYTGTQVFEPDTLLSQFEHVVDLALAVAERLGRPLEEIDFGGGFGVPYFRDSTRFDLRCFGLGYRRLVQRCVHDPRLARARLIVELGRYLVAEAGVYVTRVVDVKTSRGTTFVVTDGGMNHHIAATGNFGQVFRKPYPLVVLNRPEAAPDHPATIVGPCCTPLDCFAQGIPFPEVAEGDLVGVLMSGAYGYSASSLAFLSHPAPAEVLTWKGQVHVLRAAGRPEQVLEGQCGLPREAVAAEQRIQGQC